MLGVFVLGQAGIELVYNILMNSEYNHFAENLAEMEQRKKHWQELTEEVNQIKDRLGEGIDKDIKEAIIALKALEINTSQSCGGHDGHDGHPEGTPFVDISAPDVDDLEESLNKLLDQNPESKQIDDLIETISNRNKNECAKIRPYLEDFYKDREADPKVKLGLHYYDLAIGKLESEAVNIRERKNESTSPTQQEFESYQKEMADFTEYLKSKYFEQE